MGSPPGGGVSRPSHVRVIAGTAKGRRLRLVPGTTTRPVMDRVKESLFNILRPNLPGANFLDLFAGTGSVGIEALSQGAAHATFVDLERAAIQTIRTNLELTGLRESATVVQADAFQYLRRTPPEGFDVVYLAPPQYQGLWSRAVQAVDASQGVLNPDALVIAQLDPKEYEPIALAHLQLADQRRYGSTLLCFYEWPG